MKFSANYLTVSRPLLDCQGGLYPLDIIPAELRNQGVSCRMPDGRTIAKRLAWSRIVPIDIVLNHHVFNFVVAQPGE